MRCGSCLGVFSASANEIRLKPETRPEADCETESEEFDATLLDEEEDAGSSEARTHSDTATEDAGEDGVVGSVKQTPASTELIARPTSSPAAEIEIAVGGAPDSGDWFVRDERDISLGDLRLDDDEDDDDADLEDDSVEDSTDTSQSTEEYADTDTAHSPHHVEEYAGADIEADEAFESHEASDAIDDTVDEADDRDEPLDEAPEPSAPAMTAEPVPLRADRGALSSPRSAIPREKVALHRRLSALQDSESLGSVDEDQLEHLDELPITLATERGLSHWLGRIALTLLCIVLLISLPAQWLYAKRNLLADDPYFARLAPLVCTVFTCTERKPAYTPTAIYSQQLLVRSHPEFKDALEVSFVFHNDTALPQRFPDVELAFSNQGGVPLANRLFSPSEYLPEELRTLEAMPPNSTLQAKLELIDPGKDAVNYTLKIHDRRPAE